MHDEDRGKIKYPNRYKQPISYEGMMRRRKITPTDVDGLIDYNGVSFVYIEGKHKDAPLEAGQRKAIEHIVNSHVKAGHPSCAIIFRHECDANTTIIAKDQLVDRIYYQYKWEPPKYTCTVLGFIEKWEGYWDSKNVKL
jgi:hypothetical protein